MGNHSFILIALEGEKLTAASSIKKTITVRQPIMALLDDQYK
jgi:hypothetical protein